MVTENKPESTEVALIENFEGRLKQAVEGESKKIPKWQIDKIMNMKDKHIGSLQSQIRYLRSNKVLEFTELYNDDIQEYKDKSKEQYDLINEKREESFNKFKLKALEVLKKEFANFNSFYDIAEEYKDSDYLDVILCNETLLTNPESLSLENVRFLDNLRSSNYIRFNKKLDDYELKDIVKINFKYHYDTFFDNAKAQIEKLEKLFEESLTFNDLVTTHGIYQELKKADKILNDVSKVKIEKIEIDFSEYAKDEQKLARMVKEIDNRKAYQFKQD